MFVSVAFFVYSLLFPIVFLSLVSFFQMKWKVSKLFSSPFECGMEPLSDKRVNLHLHFFFISLLFVVFDLELAAMLPLVLLPLSEEVWSLLWLGIFFLLFISLALELEMNSLEWKDLTPV